MAGTTYSYSVRQQWMGLAKFIFFAELCKLENVQKYNDNMPSGETEIFYDDKTLSRAWELTKQIFATVEELISIDPKDFSIHLPALSTDSIDQMLTNAEIDSPFRSVHIQGLFLDLLSGVAGVYQNPQYFAAPDSEIGHLFNKIRPGLGWVITDLNVLCNVLAGDEIENADEGWFLHYGAAIFYDAAVNPDFEWNLRNGSLFGRQELCFFLHRALTTLLIALQVGAQPQLLSWAFTEMEEYRCLQIPAVKRDLADMFRSYNVDVNLASTSLPGTDMGYVPEQPLGLGGAPVVLAV